MIHKSAHAGFQELLGSLPLPVAGVLRRAAGARSVRKRHDLALAAGEAMLKLASALRIGLALDRGFEPGGAIARRLERLIFPTPALWIDLLEEFSAGLAQSPDVEGLPYRSLHEELTRAWGETSAITVFLQTILAAGTIPGGLLEDARRRGILGFFIGLVAYGETALPPGDSDESAFYEKMTPILFNALCEALASPALLGGFDLAVTVKDREGSISRQILMGLAGLLRGSST